MEQEINSLNKKNLKVFIQNLIWAIREMYIISKVDVIGVIIVSTLYSIFPSVSAYAYAKVLDEIVHIGLGGFDMFSLLDINNKLTVYILIGIAISILSAITDNLMSYLRNRFNSYNFPLFDLKLYNKISKFDVQQFEDPAISNAIQKSRDHSWRVRDLIWTSNEFFRKLVSVIISGTIAFSIAPWIAVLIIFFSIPMNIINLRHIKRWWQWYNGMVENNRKYRWLLGNITEEKNIPEHRILKSDEFLRKMIEKIRVKLALNERSLYTKRFKENIIGIFINSISWVVSPLYLVYLFFNGVITIGGFSFYTSRISSFGNDLNNLVGMFIDIFDSGIAITQVKNIFEKENIISNGSIKVDLSAPPTIEFKNVWFKYPNTERYVLKNINLHFKPGEDIAIVGENGAGKTTIIKLLLRFYDCTKGEILINGNNIKEIDLNSYYRSIGSLFQEYNRVRALTVKENIMMGDYKKIPDIKEIQKAGKKAQAHEFIEQLDKKYDQILAKEFSQGTNLSTGQWQKIALAKMFYRDANILILDEPTSSIDAQAEFKIFTNIFEYSEKMTVIIISHRFSTVRKAKRIYVINNGELVEFGSHDDLIKLNGIYKKSFEVQAKGYID